MEPSQSGAVAQAAAVGIRPQPDALRACATMRPHVNALDGSAMSDADLLDAVEHDGAVVVVRQASGAADEAVWRDGLRLAAQARGMQLLIRELGGVVIVNRADQDAPEPSDADGDAAAIAATNLRPLHGLRGGRETARGCEDHPSHGPHLRLIPGGGDA